MKTSKDSIINAGFLHNGKYRHGFQIRVKPQGDVYVFIFERGHRRMHVSYHKDGRINHNAGRPGEEHVRIMWDFSGKMAPIIRKATPVKEIVGRQKVMVTGWAAADIEKAELPEFTPNTEDIVVEPATPTVGFCVNIISPGTPAREFGELRLPVLDRYERGGAPTIEIEVFDWIAEQAPAKRLVTSIHMITSDDQGWLVDDSQRFETIGQAVTSVVAKKGMPHRFTRRNDGGVNLYYQRMED